MAQINRIRANSASKSILGVVQMCSSNNPESNLLKASRYIQSLAHKGAELICLPECFAYMGVGGDK